MAANDLAGVDAFPRVTREIARTPIIPSAPADAAPTDEEQDAAETTDTATAPAPLAPRPPAFRDLTNLKNLDYNVGEAARYDNGLDRFNARQMYREQKAEQTAAGSERTAVNRVTRQALEGSGVKTQTDAETGIAEPATTPKGDLQYQEGAGPAADRLDQEQQLHGAAHEALSRAIYDSAQNLKTLQSEAAQKQERLRSLREHAAALEPSAGGTTGALWWQKPTDEAKAAQSQLNDVNSEIDSLTNAGYGKTTARGTAAEPPSITEARKAHAKLTADRAAWGLVKPKEAGQLDSILAERRAQIEADGGDPEQDHVIAAVEQKKRELGLPTEDSLTDSERAMRADPQYGPAIKQARDAVAAGQATFEPLANHATKLIDRLETVLGVENTSGDPEERLSALEGAIQNTTDPRTVGRVRTLIRAIEPALNRFNEHRDVLGVATQKQQALEGEWNDRFHQQQIAQVPEQTIEQAADAVFDGAKAQGSADKNAPAATQAGLPNIVAMRAGKVEQPQVSAEEPVRKRVENFVQSIASGVVGGVGEIVQSIAHRADTTPNVFARLTGLANTPVAQENYARAAQLQQTVERAGASISDFARNGLVDQKIADDWEAHVGRIIGGAVPVIASAYAGQVGLYTTLFTQGHGATIEDARQLEAQGQTVDWKKVDRAAVESGALNMALGFVFDGLTKGVGDALRKPVYTAAQRAIRDAVLRAYDSGGMEGVQRLSVAVDAASKAAGKPVSVEAARALLDGFDEVQKDIGTSLTKRIVRAIGIGARDSAVFGATQAAQNVVARQYDPNRQVTAGLGDAFLGGALFGLAGAGAREIAGARRAASDRAFMADNAPRVPVARRLGEGGEADAGTSPEAGAPTAPTPADAHLEINGLQPSDRIAPEQVESTQHALRGLVKISQGQPMESLTAAERTALLKKDVNGVARVEMVKGPDGAKPVVTDAALDRVGQIAPTVRALLPQDEASQRQAVLAQVGSKNEELGTEAPTAEGSQALPTFAVEVQNARGETQHIEVQAADAEAAHAQVAQQIPAGTGLVRDVVKIAHGAEGEGRFKKEELGSVGGGVPPVEPEQFVEHAVAQVRAENGGELSPDDENQTRVVAKVLQPHYARWAKAFNAVAVTNKAQQTGGVALLQPQQHLLVSVPDVLAHAAQYAGDKEHAGRVMSEEAIHAVTTTLERAGEIDLVKLYKALPQKLRDAMKGAYKASESDYAQAHEFWRMWMQGQLELARGGKIRLKGKFLQEQTSRPFVVQNRKALARLMRYFRDMEGELKRQGIGADVLGEVSRAQNLIRAKVKEVDAHAAGASEKGAGNEQDARVISNQSAGARGPPVAQGTESAGEGARANTLARRGDEGAGDALRDNAQGAAGAAEPKPGAELGQGKKEDLRVKIGVSPEAIGRSSKISQNGRTHDVAFVAQEAAAARPSHDIQGRPTGGYDAALQPRDRSLAQYRKQSQNIANDLDFRQSAFFPETDTPATTADLGAPVMTLGGDTLIGNGREIGIKAAYDQNTPAARRYKQAFVQHAAKFGIDPAAVMKMKQPVLKRVLLEDLPKDELVRFSQESNEGVAMGSNATEVAQRDATRITPELLSLFDPNYALDSQRNAPFLRAYLRDVVKSGDANEANLNWSEIARRVRASVFTYAYGADAEGRAALARLQEDESDAGGKTITNGLLTVAPIVARMKTDIARGDLHERDISTAVARAVQDISTELRDRPKGQSAAAALDNLRDQVGFSEMGLGPEESDLVSAVRDFLIEHRTNRGEIEQALSNYVEAVFGLGNPRQGELLARETVPSALELWKQATRPEALDRTRERMLAAQKLEVGLLKSQPVSDDGERIEDAAVKLPDGRIIRANGGTHADALWNVYGDDWEAHWDDPMDDGYITSAGRFLDREQAYKLAKHYLPTLRSGDEEGETPYLETGELDNAIARENFALRSQPTFPLTLEQRGRADLLQPTKEKQSVTLAPDSRAVRMGLMRAGVHKRAQLHTAILRYFLQGGTVEGPAALSPQPKIDPQLVLLGGGGGAGKSTIAKAVLAEVHPRVVVNADEIREFIPEYEEITRLGDARGSAISHDEASELSKQLLEKALRKQVDTIYDATLSNAANTHALIDRAERGGYSVQLIGVTIHPHTAFERALMRAQHTGRYVPPEVLFDAHAKFNAALPKYLQRLGPERATVFDNSGDVAWPLAYKEVDGRAKAHETAARAARTPGGENRQAGEGDVGAGMAGALPENGRAGERGVEVQAGRALASQRLSDSDTLSLFNDYAAALPAAAKASKPALKRQVKKDVPALAESEAALGELFALANNLNSKLQAPSSKDETQPLQHGATEAGVSGRDDSGTPSTDTAGGGGSPAVAADAGETFKAGQIVGAEEGTGEVYAVRDGNVKIALSPDGRLSNWIPASRVNHLGNKETHQSPKARGERAEKARSSWELSNWVENELHRRGVNSGITSNELFRQADEAYGGTQAAGIYTPKDAYDAVEMAINRIIRYDARLSPQTHEPEAAVRELKQLISRIPTQTKRTAETDEYQQFSTVPPLAFVANWVANVKRGDVVLEPSAGVGGLAAFAQNVKARVVANELSLRRRSLLDFGGFDKVYGENAEQIDNVLPPKIQPNLVVMNPPFSATAGRMQGARETSNATRHIEQALARLEPGGRLVAIVGEGMAADRAKFKPWFAKLAERGFELRANVQVSGLEYAKYGTTWDNQILVIDKETPRQSEAATAPAAVKSIFRYQSSTVAKEAYNYALKQQEYGFGVTFEDDKFNWYGSARDQNEARAKALKEREYHEGKKNRVTSEPVVSRVEKVEDLIPLLEEIRNDRPESIGSLTGERGGVERSDRTIIGRPENDVVAPDESQRGGTTGAQQPGVAATDRGGERPDGRSEAAGGLERGQDQSDAGRLGNAGSGERPVSEPDGLVGTDLHQSQVAGATPVETPPLERAEVEMGQRRTDEALTDAVFDSYVPRIRVPGSTMPPVEVQESAAMASVDPITPTYRPAIPTTVYQPQGGAKEGKISALAMESVTLAGNAHQSMVPLAYTNDERELYRRENGAEPPESVRRGFFIGDGTGMGKGRQVMGVILDNWLQGRKKAVWVTEKPALINDAKRDADDVANMGSHIFDVAKTKVTDRIQRGQGIAFVSYATLRSAEREAAPGQKAKTRVQQLVDWFGKDFDGVIALDESHNLANNTPMKGKRGMTKPSEQALAGLELQRRLPNARIVYLSATGATEVANLGYAERLGLWGPGTPFASKQDFVAKVSSGGVAAMELVARDLKALGSYVARAISWKGVTYDSIDHALSPEQREIYDTLAEAWQGVLAKMDDALEVIGAVSAETGKTDGAAKSAARSAFWGAHQRFFNQVITSMKMPSVLKAAEGHIADGRSVVMQIVNTNEAAQNRAIDAKRAEAAESGEAADLEDLDMTPRDVLMQMVERSFPVTQREEYTDAEGAKKFRIARDSEGNPIINRQAVAMREALLDKLGAIRVPDGPLEMLLNHFGADKVAEVTGRTQRVEWGKDKEGNRVKQVVRRSKNHGIKEANEFMDDKRQVLVFSNAGGTGRSYHADLRAKNQRVRVHMLLQPGWEASKAVQGFGRTHRNNQKQPPHYSLATSDVIGEKRFMSSIARRLDQLGALTKGSRQTGSQGLFKSRDNLESEEAKAALKWFYKDAMVGAVEGITPDLLEKEMGLKMRDKDGQMLADLPPITQFLNRLLSLKLDTQTAVFDAFSDRMDRIIERAIEAGTLDQGMENLSALSTKVDENKVIHTDTRTGAQTRYVKLRLNQPNERLAFPERGETFYRNKQSGKIYVAGKAQTTTETSTGRLVDQRLLAGITGKQWVNKSALEAVESAFSTPRWEKLSNAEAKPLWEEQHAATPATKDETVHFITGTILPVWDRLNPEDNTMQVKRVQTDDGQRMIGMVIRAKELPTVLRNFGVSAENENIAPSEAVRGMLDEGATARLANGWRFKRVRVANDNRIELIGPSFTNQAEMDTAGVFSERINYKTRYFVPVDRAADVIGKLTAARPIIELQKAGDTLAAQALNEPVRLSSQPTHYATPEELERAIEVLSHNLRPGDHLLYDGKPKTVERLVPVTSELRTAAGTERPGTPFTYSHGRPATEADNAVEKLAWAHWIWFTDGTGVRISGRVTHPVYERASTALPNQQREAQTLRPDSGRADNTGRAELRIEQIGQREFAFAAENPEAAQDILRSQPSDARQLDLDSYADQNSAERFKAGLSLAMTIADRYRNIRGVDQSDVQQHARMALARAAREFNASKGEFLPFARAAINNELRGVYRTQMRHAGREDVTLDAPLQNTESGNAETLKDRITAPDDVRSEAQMAESRRVLNEAIAELPARMQRAVEGVLAGDSLETVGERLGGISRQAVGRLATEAMRRLRGKLGERGVSKVSDLLSQPTDRSGLTPLSNGVNEAGHQYFKDRRGNIYLSAGKGERPIPYQRGNGEPATHQDEVAGRFIDATQQQLELLAQAIDSQLKAQATDDPVEQLMSLLNSDAFTGLQERAANERSGGRTIGRPDLALGGTGPRIAATHEFHTDTATPQTIEGWDAEGQKILQERGEKFGGDIAQRWLNGEPLTPAEVRAAQQWLVSRQGAPKTAEAQRAYDMAAYAFTKIGEATARQLAARRDPFQTPEARNREFVAKENARLSREDEARVSAITDRQAKVKAIEQAIAGQREKTNKALASVFGKGVTLDDILSGETELRLKGAPIVQNIVSSFAEKEQRALKLLQGGERGFAEVAKMVGLGAKEVEAISERAFQKFLEKHGAKFANGLKAEAFESQGELLSQEVGSKNYELGSLSPEALAEARKAWAMAGFVDPEKQGKMKIVRRKPKATIFRPPPAGAPVTPPTAEELPGTRKQNQLAFEPHQAMRNVEPKPGESIATPPGRVLGQVGLPLYSEYMVRNGLDMGNPVDVARVMRIQQATKGNWREMAFEFGLANLLSNPTTHFAYKTSVLAHSAFEHTVRRGLEALVNLAVRDPNSAQLGEFKYLRRGLMPALANAWRIGLEQWASETDMFSKEFLDSQEEMFKKLPGEPFARGGPAIPGQAGRIIRMPLRALYFIDGFNKTLNAVMDAAPFAYRIAKREGLTGDALSQRINALVASPGSEPWQQAAERAEYITARSPLRTREEQTADEPRMIRRITGSQIPLEGPLDAMAAWVSRGRRESYLVATQMPFVNIPYNLIKMGMGVAGSPLWTPAKIALAAGTTAASVRTNRAGSEGYDPEAGFFRVEDGKHFFENYEKAKFVRDVATAMIATGIAAFLWNVAAGDGDDDKKPILLTGSSAMGGDEKKRGLRELTQRAYGGPMVLRIGGRNGFSINYGKYEPAATVLGTLADTMINLKRVTRGQETMRDAVDAIGNYIGSQLQEKSFLRGMGNIMKVVNGELSPTAAVEQTVLSWFVPGLVRAPLRNLDDYQRDTSKASFTQLLTGNLPQKIDVYGKPMLKTGNWFTRMFTLPATKPYGQLEKADALLLRWNNTHPQEAWAPSPPLPTYAGPNGKSVAMTAEQRTKFLHNVGVRFESMLRGQLSETQVKHPRKEDVERIKDFHRSATDQIKREMFPAHAAKPTAQRNLVREMMAAA